MALLTPATVHALLDAHGLHPKRSLGQNFLADPNTARRVVALADAARRATRCSRSDPASARSRSRCSTPVTTSSRSSSTTASPPCCGRVVADAGAGARVRVEHGDAMTVDLAALLAPAPSPRACVSNLPYNVAVPVVVRLLEEAPPVERILVMVQREVGERLAAGPGDAQYGAVSVKVAYFAEAQVVGLVPPTVFVPRPKVDSALVRLRRRAGAAGERAVGRRPVHAGAGRVRAAAQDAAPLAGARARRPHAPTVLDRGRASRPPRGPRRSGSTSGPRWPAARRRPSRVRLARVRATAYPKLNLSLRVLGRRPDGYHDLESLVVSLGQPHDVLEVFAVPAPGGVQVEVSGVEVGEDVPVRPPQPRVHRGREADGARRSVGPRRAPRAAQAHPGRRRARRRFRRRRGRAARGAPAARRRRRRRRRARARGRGRVRRAVLRAGRRGVDARSRRDHRAGVGADRAGVPRGHPAVPAVDPRRLQGVGQARRPAVGAGGARAPPARAGARRSWSTTSSRPPRRSSRASSSSATRSRRRRARPRCSRAAARPTWCRSPTRGRSRRSSTQVGRRLRVPVVGTTSVAAASASPADPHTLHVLAS